MATETKAKSPSKTGAQRAQPRRSADVKPLPEKQRRRWAELFTVFGPSVRTVAAGTGLEAGRLRALIRERKRPTSTELERIDFVIDFCAAVRDAGGDPYYLGRWLATDTPLNRVKGARFGRGQAAQSLLSVETTEECYSVWMAWMVEDPSGEAERLLYERLRELRRP